MIILISAAIALVVGFVVGVIIYYRINKRELSATEGGN